MKKYRLIAAVFLLASVTASDGRFPRGASSVVAPGYHVLKLGAGGLVSGIDINLDAGGTTQTMLSRTDVGGGYKWNNSTLQWDQLITCTRMPATDVCAFNSANSGLYTGGVTEIISAPSDTTVIYMMYAPSNTVLGRVFKSTNSGGTFTRTAAGSFFPTTMTANSQTFKTYGPKMAVDPANKNFVIVGLETGALILTTDGGSTWCSASGFTTSTGGVPPVGIVFDASSGTASSTLCGTTSVKTQTIYAGSTGNGVFRTINGGALWANISGSPTAIRRAKVSSTGVFYASTQDQVHLWRLVGSTWTDITQPGGQVDCFMPTPGSTAFTAFNSSGTAYTTPNAASGTPTWTGGDSSNTHLTLNTTEIPWINVDLGVPFKFIGCGSVANDALVAGKIWYANGLGVAYTTGVDSFGNPNYTDKSVGIEELVINQVISPPGGKPLVTGYDRPLFYINNPEVYPSSYGPNYNVSIAVSFGIDWATADPTYIAVASNWGSQPTDWSFSTNGGRTDVGQTNWTAYSGRPNISTNYNGGSVAASTSTNVIFMGGNANALWNTTDGANFSQIMGSQFKQSNGVTLSNMPDPLSFSVLSAAAGTGGVVRVTTSGSIGTLATNQQVAFNGNLSGGGGAVSPFTPYSATRIDSTHFELQGTTFISTFTSDGFVSTGWNNAYYSWTRPFCADRVTSNVFYAYNWQLNIAGGGFYKSTDGGATWLQKHAPINNFAGQNMLHCVLGKSGHLFWTAGQGNSSALYYSQNDGTTLTAITRVGQVVGEVYDVSSGAIKSGNDYPSIYIVGVVNGTYGIYRSDNSAADWASSAGGTQAISWTLVDGVSYPLDSSGDILTIAGDADTWNKFYIGFAETGAMYHQP